MRAGLFLSLLLCAFGAAAQSSDSATVVVPVVGSVFGATMVHWQTDLELINDTGRETDVALELTGADAPPIIVSMAPGQVQRFPNVVTDAFDTDNVLSPLRITTGGRRSVTVRAAVYAVRGAEVSPLEPIAVYAPQSWFPIRVLDDLAFSEQFRTNIGLLNYGTREAVFTLALQRLPGRNLAVTTIVVGPNALFHMSIQSIFPLITEGEHFSVVVECAAPETYVYGSVIESAHHAGRFVVPRIR
ncbi:MAG TPA: hypothetical protein VF824_23155 [Thermoanaerobaculia bacterium]|jgi:hypothetical protein